MISLMPLSELNTSIPVQYSIELSCSEDNLQNNIEEVAAFVSKVYAKFPSLGEEGRKQLRTAGVWFDKPRELASASECEQFEIALKNRIIAVLNQKEYWNCSIDLSTDYCPETALYEVAQSVFDQKNELSYLFSYKTCTHICLSKEKSELRLDMRFKGPSF